MVEAIPIDVLIHTISYERYVGEGRYGEGYDDPIIISNVLVQYAFSVEESGLNQEKNMKALLFIDCTNSSPPIKLEPRSKVILEGDSMTVKVVKPVYAFSLHHYEIELI